MHKYLLSKTVHLCVDSDCAVLLDLRNDEYVGLDKEQVTVMSHLVRGWPNPNGQGIASEMEADSNALAFASRLAEKGLLTSKEAHGKDAAPSALRTVPRSEIAADYAADCRMTARDVIRYLFAATHASVNFRLRPLDRAIARISRRKELRAKSASHLNSEEIQRVINIAVRLRPLLYTHRDECLFDSLVLVDFFARYNFYPTLIIGVRTNPFFAHAWVQHETQVFNDSIHFVRGFKPILIV